MEDLSAPHRQRSQDATPQTPEKTLGFHFLSNGMSIDRTVAHETLLKDQKRGRMAKAFYRDLTGVGFCCRSSLVVFVLIPQ